MHPRRYLWGFRLAGFRLAGFRLALAFTLVLSFVLWLALLSGCVTAISTMEPAETLPRGAWRLGVGSNVNVPVGQIGAAVDAATEIADRYRQDSGYTPSEEEQRKYLGAAIGLALNQPAVLSDLMVRYGLRDGLEVGARYAGNALYLGGKLRLFDESHQLGGWQGALSASYVRTTFSGLIFDVLSFLRIDDFSRHDIHLPLIFGRRLDRFGHVWLGPKYIYGQTRLDGALQNVDQTLSTTNRLHYFGGFGGVAVGFSRIFVLAELTVMNMFARPVVLGAPVDIGGIVVMPSLGVMARF